MPALAALQYSPDAFDTRVGKLMGRQMAGQTFLQAWVRYSGADPLTSWTSDTAKAEAFQRQVREYGANPATAAALPTNVGPLRAAGALWLADPAVADYAWKRRWLQQDAWSIVGITHTMSTHAAMARVSALLTAPVQPWDALICTSQAIRQVVQTVLDAEADYLKARLGATRFQAPMLPVIPLGVPCDALVHDPAARAHWRTTLGLGDDDIAVLQFGRLILHGKAHPVPLYLALAQAGQSLGRPLHLILAGNFATEAVAGTYRDLARHFADRVVTHFVDGNAPGVEGLRSAADIGTLLSDSIQETFGLAPVELMAVGLPLVASDWDGLRDTVEHGVTGFRIDMTMPPPGAGVLIARRYDTLDTLDQFLAAATQSTAADIGQAAQAFATLAADPALRRRMGQAGRARAERLFDWPVVIAAYRELLAALEERRRAGQGERAPRNGGAVKADKLDPFHAFAGYSTHVLAGTTRVSGVPGARERLADLAAPTAVILMHASVMPPMELIDAVAERARAGMTIDELDASFPQIGADMMFRTIGWLLKYGLLQRD